MQFTHKNIWAQQIKEFRQKEADAVQLSLFKDRLAEELVKDYEQFIAAYPNRIADYLNSAYLAIVKNMPATDSQKKSKVCNASDFSAIRVKDGTGQVRSWECKIGRDLHNTSLAKAIASALKSKENKYENKEFCLIRLYDDKLQFWINKDLFEKVNDAIHKVKKT